MLSPGGSLSNQRQQSASLAAPCSLFCWLQSSLWRRQEIYSFENVSITLFNLYGYWNVSFLSFLFSFSLYLFVFGSAHRTETHSFLHISVWCTTFTRVNVNIEAYGLLLIRRCVRCVDVIFFIASGVVSFIFYVSIINKNVLNRPLGQPFF